MRRTFFRLALLSLGTSQPSLAMSTKNCRHLDDRILIGSAAKELMQSRHFTDRKPSTWTSGSGSDKKTLFVVNVDSAGKDQKILAEALRIEASLKQKLKKEEDDATNRVVFCAATAVCSAFMWFGAYTLQDYSNWTVIPGGMGMLGAFLGGIGFLGGQHVDPSVAREANSLSKGTKDRVINSKYVQALMNIIPPGTYGIIFADDPTRKAAVDSKPAAPKPTTAQMVAKEEALLSALRTDLATIPNPTKPRLTPEEFRAEVNSEAEALMGQINDRLGTTYTPTSLPTADELRQRIAYSGQSNLLDEILLTRLDILSLKRKALPPE